MATLAQNRDERGNAIVSYYNNLQTYNTNVELDGTNLEADKPQARFKTFNDLIALYHYELEIATGYLYSSSGYVDPDEGAIPGGFWWENARVTNLQSSWFYIDSEAARSIYGHYYFLNTQSDPNKKHPYLHWNQYGTILGSYDDHSWKNAADRSLYTDIQNPFATGANFRMAEPLEYYGDSANLLWGNIVYDGRWAYRREYSGDTSYDTHVSSGLYDYQANNRPISNIAEPHTNLNRYPSTWQIFYNTFWGTGIESTITTSLNIDSHSGTTSGSFTTPLGTTGPAITDGNWYMIYTASAGYGYILRITGTSTGGTSPDEYTIYNYDNALWPVPASGAFSGSGITLVENPSIAEAVKTGGTSNGRRNVWTSIYSQYYSSFSSAISGITSAAQEWSLRLDGIINFDYTIISDTDVAGSELYKSNTQSFKTTLDSWISAWQAIDKSFTTFDAGWVASSLNNLLTNASGGLNQLIDFGTAYSATPTGIIVDRKNETYNTIVGEYSKGTDEDWNASINTFSENNTGNFTAGTLNWYRHNYADSRINREEGLLTIAYSSWVTYNAKLILIDELEVQMDPVITDAKYDIVPTGLVASNDVDDAVELDWDDTKAAASYDLEYKEGLSGSWQTIATNLGYIDPGDPPDFTVNPASQYNQLAYTRGYQDITVTYSDSEDATGLTVTDFTRYYLQIELDGNPVIETNIRGMDGQTWEALIIALNDRFEEDGIGATAELTASAVRIYSNTVNGVSTISLAAGTTNDLISALSGSLSPAVAGVTYIEPGKVYYYRVKVNNGYNVSLGSDGNEEDKDWDSQSDWQNTIYSNDRFVHGDAGYITWPDPENLLASGVNKNNGITPSETHCRLEWESAINASNYKIYRATSVDGGYAYIGSTSNSYYEDTTGIPGFIYFYKVRAVADADFQVFDDNGNLSGPIESALTPAAQGKKLWQTITLSVSTEDRESMTLEWTPLSGATGYLIFSATLEQGPHTILTNDDSTDLIVNGETYIDNEAAKHFASDTFNSSTDGIPDTEYTANQRYYFIVTTTNETDATIRQYYITSPSSGTWEIGDIVNSISTKINEGLANVDCELVAMENLADDTVYKIRFKTHLENEFAQVEVLGGTFGESLLPLLGGMDSATPGGSALPGVTYYYRVQGVEVIDGEQVRASELSNVAMGLRPLI